MPLGAEMTGELPDRMHCPPIARPGKAEGRRELGPGAVNYSLCGPLHHLDRRSFAEYRPHYGREA